MAKIVVKNKIKKIKKKFLVNIQAPSFMDNKIIGKSNVTDLKTFVGKVVTMNLMYITGNMRNQNLRISMRVVDVESDKAKTEMSKYEYISYHLKRNLKKDVDLIEDSFNSETKDNKVVTFKPFLVTKNKVSGSVKTQLRVNARKEILEYVKTINSQTVFQETLNEKLQIKVRNELKKVSPIKSFEFRKVVLK